MVAGASLRRDWIDIRLAEGRFYALAACERTVGLLFLGQGEAEIRSPGPLRAPQLHVRSEDLPGTVLFDAAVLLAADGAVDELLGQTGGWTTDVVPPGAYALAQQRLEGLDPARGPRWAPPGEVLASGDAGGGGLMLDLRTLGVRWFRPERSLEVFSPFITYVRAPTGPLGDPTEPILLLRRPVGSTEMLILAGLPSEASVAAQDTPFASDAPDRSFDLLDVTVRLVTSGPVGPDHRLEDLEGWADLTLRAGEEAGDEVALLLSEGVLREHGDRFAPLEVHAVAANLDDALATPTDALRVGDRLFVRLPIAPEPGALVHLSIHYGGGILETRGNTAIATLGPGAFYPRRAGTDRHRLTMLVAVPAFWEVAATGHRIEEERIGTVRTVTSRSNEPVPHGLVAITDARVETRPPAGPGLPLVRIHRNAEGSVPNARIGPELDGHLRALAELLGPFPYSELEIVERGNEAMGFADSPGVIGVARFDSPPDQVVTTSAGGDSLLGALTRQWLVADLGAATSHDEWLIEGLVVIARCVALEAADQGGRCQGDLTGARRQWLDRFDGGSVGADQQWRDLLAGAVWAADSSGAAWANRAVRGPLILQMLRLLVGDEVLFSTLRAVRAAYGGQGLSLASFLNQLQGRSGLDLRPFIFGWVLHSPPLPTARLAYRVLAQGETYSITGEAWIDDGRDTEPASPLPTPILVSFRVGDAGVVRRLVLAETPTSFSFDGLPGKPTDITLDPAGTFPGRVDLQRSP